MSKILKLQELKEELNSFQSRDPERLAVIENFNPDSPDFSSSALMVKYEVVRFAEDFKPRALTVVQESFFEPVQLHHALARQRVINVSNIFCEIAEFLHQSCCVDLENARSQSISSAQKERLLLKL